MKEFCMVYCKFAIFYGNHDYHFNITIPMNPAGGKGNTPELPTFEKIFPIIVLVFGLCRASQMKAVIWTKAR